MLEVPAGKWHTFTFALGVRQSPRLLDSYSHRSREGCRSRGPIYEQSLRIRRLFSFESLTPLAHWVQTAIMLERKLLVKEWKASSTPTFSQWYKSLGQVAAYERL